MSESVILVDGIAKHYRIYEKPSDRLKEMFLAGRQKFHREFWALQDISFAVPRGSMVGVVGMNGSGKSTLLQIIAGILAPSRGRVETHGRLSALLELGAGFNPEFTGRQNVYMSGEVLGLSRREIAALEEQILAFADIGDFIDQPVKTYSNGMNVRLAFAVATVTDPEILLIDEAIAVGDTMFQHRCFARVKELAVNGTTILLVSHDIEVVRTMCHRALLLDHGKLLLDGPAAEVVNRYYALIHEREEEYLRQCGSDRIRQTLSAGDQTYIRESGFGTGEVKIVGYELYDANGQPRRIFRSGDLCLLRMEVLLLRDIDKLNCGFRIRDKQGNKIYSMGAMNKRILWGDAFHAGDTVEVDFSFRLILGMNSYSLSLNVTEEGDPHYHQQRILEWIDEALVFEVKVDLVHHFFGGMVDLDAEICYRKRQGADDAQSTGRSI